MSVLLTGFAFGLAVGFFASGVRAVSFIRKKDRMINDLEIKCAREEFISFQRGNRLNWIASLSPGPRGNGTARKMARIARGDV